LTRLGGILGGTVCEACAMLANPEYNCEAEGDLKRTACARRVPVPSGAAPRARIPPTVMF